MRRFWAWALCAPLLVGLGGCAGPRPNLHEPTETEVAANLRTAFDYLYDNYYEEIRLENVVIPGLENLRVLEPDLSVALARISKIEAYVEVRLRDELIYRVRDAAWYAGDGWSAIVRSTIKALRTASPRMADATWVETTDLVLAGVAKALDSNAVYLSRSEMKAVGLVVDDESAKDDGIKKPREQKAAAGIRLRYLDRTTRIAQVRRNSAAAQAGLRPGDTVETLEGQPADTYSRLQMNMQFVGTPDSEMTLTVRRADGTEHRTVVLRRETVDDDSPVAMWRNGILYLQVTDLWGETVDYVKKLLQAEREKAAEGVSGIVIHLRGTAVASPFAAARFLDVFYEGDERYFSTIGQSYLGNYTFRPRERPEDTAIRLVVLANGETAAAAEGMVLALQDLGRAVVVGSATSGQGYLQTGSFLLNGGLIAFPYARLVTPANFAIEKRGVLPTVCSGALNEGQAAVVQLKSGQGIINQATRNRKIATGNNAAIRAHRDFCPPRIDQDDRDLELAEAILADPTLYDQILAAGTN
ncbi:MAG: PDZ domain-containing protein [Kiloniellaceae bacterium]|nr:PDZ domain-containing protein [Kiloniellaceae bacterium]